MKRVLTILIIIAAIFLISASMIVIKNKSEQTNTSQNNQTPIDSPGKTPNEALCGNDICDKCEVGLEGAPYSIYCPKDCGEWNTPTCGDGICDKLAGEKNDCGFGCFPPNAGCATNPYYCPEDCSTSTTCGDGICESGEDEVIDTACTSSIPGSCTDILKCPEDCNISTTCGKCENECISQEALMVKDCKPTTEKFKCQFVNNECIKLPTTSNQQQTCTSDSDCTLKPKQYCCGELIEYYNTCYNINNEPEDINCEGEISCAGRAAPPTSCKCEDNKCIGTYIDAPPFTCTTNSDCNSDYTCYNSQICSPTPSGTSCGDQQGDLQCHKNCEDDNDCPSEMPTCRETSLFTGNAGTIAKFCVEKIEVSAVCGNNICDDNEYGPYVVQDGITPDNSGKTYCLEDCPASI